MPQYRPNLPTLVTLTVVINFAMAILPSKVRNTKTNIVIYLFCYLAIAGYSQERKQIQKQMRMQIQIQIQIQIQNQIQNQISVIYLCIRLSGCV